MSLPAPFNPQITSYVSGYFDKTCTILEAVESRGASGAVMASDWQPVEGLSNIPCRLASVVLKRANNEVRTADGTYVDAPYEALLLGNFPQIEEKWRAQIDSVDYDIVLVSLDDAAITTHLALKITR